MSFMRKYWLEMSLEKIKIESSGYSQYASLLAHNQITAPQFIRRRLHAS